ncbi:band 3 anion exchange protein-like [Rhincodon typus]|uniref:band 3 anion exchange protein-like n=1 Tax=Rhincodon typus TaxID=259920 RepID=UPI00202FA34C|nr:band 3 anion exchange protein-like [Rhincodon typus]
MQSKYFHVNVPFKKSLTDLCELLSCSPKVRLNHKHEKKTAHGGQPFEAEGSPKPHTKYKPHLPGRGTVEFARGTNLPQVTSADDLHTQRPRRSQDQSGRDLTGHGEATYKQAPQVFVEMNELKMDEDKHQYWQETGRWIKYEEDLDKDSDRWGKAHVPSLTFRSLLELKRGISKGAVLLDLEGTTFSGISVNIVEEMIAKDQIRAENKISVLNALLQKTR